MYLITTSLTKLSSIIPNYFGWMIIKTGAVLQESNLLCLQIFSVKHGRGGRRFSLRTIRKMICRFAVK